MFGFGMMTPEMLQRWFEREQERTRRVEALVASSETYMSRAEAYMRVSTEMEWEVWRAVEEAKLADIRENGT